MTESMPENDVTISKNIEEEYAAVYPPTERRNKKKSGGFGIFKAALHMMRKRRSDKKPAPKIVLPETDAAKDQSPNWTKLVDSVRPFHLQEIADSPPSSPGSAMNDGMTEMISESPFHLQEIVDSPASSPGPAMSETISLPSPTPSSSRGTMSHYSSTLSLLDLDNSSDEEEEDPDEVFDALTGDEMIDAKAEEFIAQFYKQMHIQRTTNYPGHHHQLSRGI